MSSICWMNRFQFNRTRAISFLASIMLCSSSLLLTGCSSRRTLESAPKLVGTSLPNFRGEALDERAVKFPEEIRGRAHLLLVAYVQEAQFDVDRWVLGVLQAKAPVRVLELPTIASLGARLAKGFINRGMQQGIPKEDWASVVTVYGDADLLRSYVGDIPGNNACALLIDSEGVVRWVHRDGYSPRELIELVEAAKGIGSERGERDNK